MDPTFEDLVPGHPAYGVAGGEVSFDDLIPGHPAYPPPGGELSFEDLIPTQSAPWQAFTQSGIPPVNPPVSANLESGWGRDLNAAQDLSLLNLGASRGASDAQASSPSEGARADASTPVRWQPPGVHYFGADGAFGSDGVGGGTPAPHEVQEVVVTGRRHTPWWRTALNDLGTGFRLAGDFGGGVAVGAGSEVWDMAKGLATLGWNVNPVGLATSDLVHLGLVNGSDVPPWLPDSDRITQPIERVIGDLAAGKLDPRAQFGSWLDSWRDTAKQGPDALAYRAGNLFGHGAAFAGSFALGGAAGAAGDAAKVGEGVADAGRLGGVAAATETPLIGNSGYRSISEFTDAVSGKYQELYDQHYARTMRLVDRGLVPNDPLVYGSRTDTMVRADLRNWLKNAEGIEEGPDKIIRVNRRLYDPSGAGSYRIPDVYIPDSHTILDGSLSFKTRATPQIGDFRAFSNGANTTIIRPASAPAGKIGGSYGIVY